MNNKLQSDPRFTCRILAMELQKLTLYASSAVQVPIDVLSMGEILFDLIDLLLLQSPLHVKKDIVDNLRMALIFLISFIVDSPETNENTADGELILTRAKNILNDIASYITSQIEEDLTEESNSLILLPDLLQVVNTVKADVTDLYTADISTVHFQRTDVSGFIDSFLIELKEMLECPLRSSNSFLKHQVSTVQQEFLSLKPLLRNVSQLQNALQGLGIRITELEDLWIRIANVSYHAKDVVNSLFYRSDSIWQKIICLSDVMEGIKQIKCDIEKYDARVFPCGFSVDSLLPVQVNTLRIQELVMGLKDEEDKIIDHLLGRKSQLHIIAICGMGGLGKTTLASRVYHDPSVKPHFHVKAWCTVSRTYRKEKILLDILGQIIDSNDGVSEVKETELAAKLRQILKKRRYLIIIDDIWDINAWDAVKESFPDDGEGSRIIFTTRIHNLAFQSDFTVHPLRPLSNDESWKLLQMKLFQNYDYLSDFAKVGKQIANGCKGLPLSVVLIAGLLSTDVENLDWWKQIAQSLVSQIASKGGTNTLELSYNHLPEYLKPCFLYFGAYHEDKVIRVQKLIHLWISEGFVHEDKKKLLEDVAGEYLTDLVARSLVSVTKRSSTGRIKACEIHDLLREFCLAKAKKELFLRVVRENVFPSSWYALSKHCRLSIQTKDWMSFFYSNPSHPGVHSLLFSLGNTFGSFKWIQYFSFIKYKFIRLLDLEDVKVLGDFPKEIVVLVLLRYLAIRCTKTSIPPSVANLGNLEVFRVRGTQSGFRLPDTIWKMKRLRHVDIGICIASSDMFSQLDNVQSFSTPCIFCGEDVQNLLRKIPRVRKLRCELHQSRDKGNMSPVLNFLSKLKWLNVIYNGRQLSDCKFMFPPTLRKLTLSSFRLPWEKIAAIKELPNLEVLKLLKNAFKGECWEVKNDEFTKLKFLKLCKLNLRKWDTHLYALPCLQRLVVEKCDNLEEIPASIGEIDSLMMIQVHWSSSGAEISAKQIQEENGKEDFEVHIIESQSETVFPVSEFWDL